MKKNKFDKIYYLIEMVKASGVEPTEADLLSLEVKLVPYQERYEEVKELSIKALRKGKIKDYNAYISELSFIYSEMKDIKNNCMYILESKHNEKAKKVAEASAKKTK